MATLPARERAAVEGLLDAVPESTRARRLSPWEVWEQGRRALTRLGGAAVAEIMGLENAVERGVGQDHCITFEDREIGPGVHAYLQAAKRLAIALGEPPGWGHFIRAHAEMELIGMSPEQKKEAAKALAAAAPEAGAGQGSSNGEEGR